MLGGYFEVYNRLGPGLGETIYHRESLAALRTLGCTVASQRRVGIRYGQFTRSRFRPDLIVDRQVIVEIKARPRILNSHWAQLLNYMRITGIEVGMVVNFGPGPEFKRVILDRKG